jgi:hypothetical protein
MESIEGAVMNEEQLRQEYEKEMMLREQYEREMGTLASGAGGDDNFLEEAHPDISASDRLLVKNFSKDDETTKKFLQTKYPNMEFEQKDGRLFMRKYGEDKFRALDPDNLSLKGMASYFTNPTELLRDIGDIGYDAAAGTAETLASIGAGAAAGAATGGTAAIPAAMAAGGGTGALMETIRQKAGQAMGLPQEDLDALQVAISGGAGALSPLLFGTGAGAKEVAKSLGKNATEEMIEQGVRSQRGVAKRVYDFGTEKVFPKAAEVVTGVPSQATATMAKKLDSIEELNSEGVLGYAEQVHEKLVDGLQQVKTQSGRNLEAAIDGATDGVDIREVKKHFVDMIDSIKKKGAPNQQTQALLESLQAQYDELFTVKKPRYKQLSDGTVEQLDDDIIPMPDKIPANQAFSLQDQLRDAAELFRTKQGTVPRFQQSASRTEKKAMQAAGDAYRSLNKEFDRVTSGLAPKYKEEWQNLSALQRHLNPFFKDPSTTFKTLSNLGKQSRRPLFETLERLQKNYNIDLVTPAKELEAFSYYGKPTLDAISGGGTTSTSRTIPLAVATGMAGGYIGSQQGGFVGGTAGSILGTLLGGKMASPAMVKALVKAGKFAERNGGKITPPAKINQGAANSAWLMMNDRE